MKKARTILFVIAVLTISLTARGDFHAHRQNSDHAQSAPFDLIRFDWKYEGYARSETVSEQNSVGSSKTTRGSVYVFKYVSKVVIKNTSDKTIKSLVWHYLFVDPSSQKELKRYKFQVKQEIAPGATETLTKAIALDPKESTKHITTGTQKVIISRIEYADGSTWKQ